MKTYLVRDKRTGQLVDTVRATGLESLLEDYDYSPEYFDITEE